jgi:hypothetical protein
MELDVEGDEPLGVEVPGAAELRALLEILDLVIGRAFGSEKSDSASANCSGRRSSSTESEETNVPDPWRVSTMFIACRDRIASRTVGRLTPRASLRARSEGS